MYIYKGEHFFLGLYNKVWTIKSRLESIYDLIYHFSVSSWSVRGRSRSKPPLKWSSSHRKKVKKSKKLLVKKRKKTISWGKVRGMLGVAARLRAPLWLRACGCVCGAAAKPAGQPPAVTASAIIIRRGNRTMLIFFR